jgi:methionine-gamma-lyase
VVTPIYQSTAFAVDEARLSTARHAADEPSYSRDRFPNARELELAVADLEGADAGCAAASGMAAISLVFLTFLAASDHLVLARGAYCDTEDLVAQVLARFDVRATLVDMTDPAAVEAAIEPRTRLLFVETIANPTMQVPDLDALAAIAARHDALLVVDNTFATPVLCHPLEHGADLVVHSATKFLGGHHDLTAGVVAGSSDLIGQVRRTAYLLGTLPSTMDAWLALRGIRTLAPRMAWITQTAGQVARWLESHPVVGNVRYPGLDTGEVVARMLPDGAGGMLAFRVEGGDAAAEAVIRRLRLIPYVPSLGGTGTTICFPPRTLATRQGARAGEGWLRLSVGLESPEDLIADLAQALEGDER